MIESSCHCGAVKLKIDAEPPDMICSCNCSVCRRTGALTAYFNPAQVKVIAKPEAMHRYVWGDKSMAFVRCSTCGCHTHWESLDPNQKDRMGVNTRNFENLDTSKIRIRRFDGADSWTYID